MRTIYLVRPGKNGHNVVADDGKRRRVTRRFTGPDSRRQASDLARHLNNDDYSGAALRREVAGA